jgi:hypothetical protein
MEAMVVGSNGDSASSNNNNSSSSRDGVIDSVRGSGTDDCSECAQAKELLDLAKKRMRHAETNAKEEMARASRAEERAREAEEKLANERVLLKTYLESFAAFHTERHSRLEQLVTVGKCPRR